MELHSFSLKNKKTGTLAAVFHGFHHPLLEKIVSEEHR
jgi:hypothetical protein